MKKLTLWYKKSDHGYAKTSPVAEHLQDEMSELQEGGYVLHEEYFPFKRPAQDAGKMSGVWAEV